MKYLFQILLFALITFCNSELNAQFGVRAGVNFANLSSKDAEDVIVGDGKLGLSAGVFYNAQIDSSLSVQFEMNYIQFGTKAKEESITFTSYLNYLQIPILAKYKFGNKNGLNFYAQAGPYIGIGLGKIVSKLCGEDDCLTDTNSYDINGINAPKPSDFGLQFGGGVNINSNVSIDGRYILGVMNIRQSDYGQLRNKGINVTVAYTL